MSTALLDWGLTVIAWLQRASPALDWPFCALTALGDIEFILLFLPLIYWSIDRAAGLRLGVFYVLSAVVNGVAKAILQQPRPHDYAASAVALIEQDGYGLPSGHTQNSVVLWGAIAAHWRQPWVRWLCGALIVLVPLSRVYLGVHFPTDVLAGYVLGALLLWALLTWAPRLPRATSRLWLAPVLAVALLAIMAPFLPRLPADVSRGAGALAGLAIGLALERRLVRFRADGPLGRRLGRAALGLAVLAALYLGLSALLGGLEPAWLWRVLRYLVLGLWMAWAAPALFVRLGLASPEVAA